MYWPTADIVSAALNRCSVTNPLALRVHHVGGADAVTLCVGYLVAGRRRLEPISTCGDCIGNPRECCEGADEARGHPAPAETLRGLGCPRTIDSRHGRQRSRKAGRLVEELVEKGVVKPPCSTTPLGPFLLQQSDPADRGVPGSCTRRQAAPGASGRPGSHVWWSRARRRGSGE
jgi:hypothetical protein